MIVIADTSPALRSPRCAAPLRSGVASETVVRAPHHRLAPTRADEESPQNIVYHGPFGAFTGLTSSPRVARSARLSLGVGLFAIIVAAGCGRSRGNLAAHLAPTQDITRATDQARCGVTKNHDRPLIIEWPSADRGALESQVLRGDHLVVVRYEGCEMEVLRHCYARGRYAFSGVQQKVDNSSIRSADELYAKIPLGAARLEAELERHGALSLAMTYVGAYEAERGSLTEALESDALEGRCDGATHVVTNLSVGAFKLTSASGAGVKAGAEVGLPGGIGEGAGGGLSSTHARGFRRSDGDPAACDGYSHERPPEGCGALLRIEVEAISPGEGPQSANANANAKNRDKDRNRRDNERPAKGRCPRGSVEVEGGVFTPSSTGEWGSWGGNQSVDGLCVGIHEVTVAEYSRCARAGACSQAPTTVDWAEISDAEREERSSLCNGSKTKRRKHPVNCVSWHQAESYCRAQGGRLPTEAEWEWVARGGDQQRSYAWGEDDPDPELVNACGRECSKNENLFDRRDGNRGTAKTGSYRRGRGRWYLEDLAGNVWEWTQSGDSDERVIRGGSFWSIDDDELRVGGREAVELRSRRADVGFRCVWEPTQSP